MKTRATTITNLMFSVTFCLGLASCNKEDFYEKEFLENPFQNPTTTGSVDSGSQGGVDGGLVGGTQGGVDSGVDGGTSGSTTGSSTSGTTDGGSTAGSTTGSTTSGSSTSGSTTSGSTTGGNTGSTTSGSTTGSTTSGTTTSGSTTSGTTTGGIVYETKEEIFYQSKSETKKLDIVWIIDNSGSMSDEQASLGSNFSAFIDDFITKDVDFQMAVTTTDTSTEAKKGKMVFGSDVKLTSAKAKANEAQFKSDFKYLVNQGVSGSGNEKRSGSFRGFHAKIWKYLF
jgi:hypothetical protein